MKISLILFSIFALLLFNTTSAQISGCIDPLATNFNPSATINDGSCTYNAASAAPKASFNLAANVIETSGLITWNNQVWTHNDSDDLNIYALDTTNGNLIKSYPLPGVTNTDWEEISQDENYVYLGDFGNNSNGNRTDLKILRIDKNSILTGKPVIETINYSYSNQTSFTPAGSRNTDFDCEACIVSADSIFLFTKQWVSRKTSVYSVSKTPGTHIAKLKSTFDVQGLITGATYLETKKLVALSGYSTELQPFIYLLYDFKGYNFFDGNKRKIQLSLPFHQVEGITSNNGTKYYISNEYYSLPPSINVQQKLHILDLSPYLSYYLNNLVGLPETQIRSNDKVFPNPAKDFITLKTDKSILPVNYRIINDSGKIVMNGKLVQENQGIFISGLSAGAYILYIVDDHRQAYRFIKK